MKQRLTIPTCSKRKKSGDTQMVYFLKNISKKRRLRLFPIYSFHILTLVSSLQNLPPHSAHPCGLNFHSSPLILDFVHHQTFAKGIRLCNSWWHFLRRASIESIFWRFLGMCLHLQPSHTAYLQLPSALLQIAHMYIRLSFVREMILFLFHLCCC